MNNKINNKKGFTMVELLATIVILGILSSMAIVAVTKVIVKSKDTKMIQQKNSLEMAAKSYLEANRDRLPKGIGEERIIYAYELKDANYLKEKIKDSSGQDCTGSSDTKKSYVKVYKYSKTEYTYTTILHCKSTEVPSPTTTPTTSPSITINVENIAPISDNYNLNNTKLIISISGDEQDDTIVPLQGYSYSILSNNKEIYNSGTLPANKQEAIQIEKKLTDCINLASSTSIIIRVTARDISGGYNTVSSEAIQINVNN